MFFRFTREYVIDGGQQHAQAETYQEAYHQYLILQVSMYFQELEIEYGQTNE